MGHDAGDSSCDGRGNGRRFHLEGLGIDVDGEEDRNEIPTVRKNMDKKGFDLEQVLRLVCTSGSTVAGFRKTHIASGMYHLYT